MYSLEKKNSNLDYPKRQILLVQENYKVLVPVLVVLIAGLLALNISNAIGNFMAVYVCVIVNVIGVGLGVGVLLRLIKGNLRQRNLFEQIVEKTALIGECERVMKYVSDTEGAIKGAKTVLLYETESEYVIVPQLPCYKHVLFTRYDFRSDFGKLRLSKNEYKAIERENGVSFVASNYEFVFEIK